MRWLACELHTHTFHSDGRQSLSELAEGSIRLGFECFALTDHNTMSGLEDSEQVEREWGTAIIPGMEWTTFYGHMIMLGIQDFVDWREAEKYGIHKGIADIHRKGGLVGMASFEWEALFVPAVIGSMKSGIGMISTTSKCGRVRFHPLRPIIFAPSPCGRIGSMQASKSQRHPVVIGTSRSRRRSLFRSLISASIMRTHLPG